MRGWSGDDDGRYDISGDFRSNVRLDIHSHRWGDCETYCSPADSDSYFDANANRYSYADADRHAHADANTDRYACADAQTDCHSYANTHPNRNSYANANADRHSYTNANTHANRYAYANANRHAYVDTHADAHPYANGARACNWLPPCDCPGDDRASCWHRLSVPPGQPARPYPYQRACCWWAV